MDGIDPNAPSYFEELLPGKKAPVPEALRRDYDYAVEAASDMHKAMAMYYHKYEGDTIKAMANGQAENRPRVNLIASTIEQMVAMNSWSNPRITALPVETGDVQQSHEVNALFRYWQHHFKLRDLQERMNRMGFICGTAIARVDWFKSVNLYERGDFRVSSTNPMNFHPDPHATCLEDLRHCTFDTVWSVEAAEAQWPGRIKLAADVATLDSYSMRAIPARSVVVHETIYTPTAKTPEGRVIRWTSFGLLEDETEIKTPDHRLPFVVFYNVQNPTSFWGISEVHNMVPVQASYNNILYYITQALKYVSVNKYVTNDAGLKDTHINMNSSEPIVLEGGDKSFFKPIERPLIDQSNISMLGLLFADIQQVSGVHGVQEGNPGAVTAATALQTLAQLGSKRMDTRKLHMADAMGDIAELLLEMAGKGKMYTHKHFLRVLGQDAPIELDPEHIRADYDIMCSYQESFPEEINARLQMMAQMAAMKPDQRSLIARWTGDPLLIETAMEFAKSLKEGAAVNAEPTVEGAGGQPAPSEAPATPTVTVENGNQPRLSA